MTDPLALYRYMVSAGEIRQDEEQLRALVKIRKLHQELLDYTPPITLLTLLESLRPTNDPLAGKIPDWPFQRSPLSSVGTGLLPEEEDERERLLAMSEKTRSTELVKVLKENQGLEDLDTPRGFLLTGPPGTYVLIISSLRVLSLADPGCPLADLQGEKLADGPIPSKLAGAKQAQNTLPRFLAFDLPLGAF